MASILEQPAVREAVLPISVEQYHRLGEAGIVPERTELLRGIVVEQMIKTPLHTWTVQRLVDWLRSAAPAGLHVRQEQPLTLKFGDVAGLTLWLDGKPTPLDNSGDLTLVFPAGAHTLTLAIDQNARPQPVRLETISP